MGARAPALAAALSVAAFAALLHGAAWASVFPEQAAYFDGSWSDLRVFSQYEYSLPEPGLERILAPGTRILGEDAFAHALIAKAGAGFELVPVWSPEVAFLFDATLTPRQQRARLLERNVGAVLICSSANTAFCLQRPR